MLSSFVPSLFVGKIKSIKSFPEQVVLKILMDETKGANIYLKRDGQDWKKIGTTIGEVFEDKTLNLTESAENRQYKVRNFITNVDVEIGQYSPIENITCNVHNSPLP
jgi:hypothetical protein